MRSWIQIAPMGPLQGGLLSGSPPETPACARMWYWGANLRAPAVGTKTGASGASPPPSLIEASLMRGASVAPASLMSVSLGDPSPAPASVMVLARDVSCVPPTLLDVDVGTTP